MTAICYIVHMAVGIYCKHLVTEVIHELDC